MESIKGKKWICAGLIFLLITLMCACSSEKAKEEDTDETNSIETSGEQLVTCEYTKRDVSGTYDEDESTKVTLSESYTVTEEGVYVFSGTLKDGQIIVDADDEAKIQIVLNNVNITSSNGPAIYVKGANKVFITLEEGSENTLSDGKTYASSEDEPWGCIFSKSDLTINGKGSLTVNGNYNNGIVSKDDLRITAGNINITAVNNGIKGRDSVGILDGNIAISASGDGIKSNNDEDEEKGYVSIDGGSIEIKNTTSQGIQGESVVQVTGGTINIDSENEGIQGKIVYISGGNIDIKATDDGINATEKSTSNLSDFDEAQEGVYIEIKDGDVNIEASGDGIDSNGDLYIKGGTCIINGPTNGGNGSLDYNGKGEITGGTFIAFGSVGMAQNFDSNSSQCAFMYSVSGNSGDNVAVADGDGNEIVSETSGVNFTSLIISSSKLTKGESYTLKIGDSESEITLSDTVTSIGGGSMDNGSVPGGNMDGPGGRM